MTAPVGMDPLDDSIRKRVAPKACALGGEAVSLSAAGGGLGPLAPQGIAFAVWAKKKSGGDAPRTWTASANAKSPSATESPPAMPSGKAQGVGQPMLNLPPPPAPASPAPTSNAAPLPAPAPAPAESALGPREPDP